MLIVTALGGNALLRRHPGQRGRRDPDVGTLMAGGHGLAAAEQCIASQGDDDAHRSAAYRPIVATMTALMVCIRFSA